MTLLAVHQLFQMELVTRNGVVVAAFDVTMGRGCDVIATNWKCWVEALLNSLWKCLMRRTSRPSQTLPAHCPLPLSTKRGTVARFTHRSLQSSSLAVPPVLQWPNYLTYLTVQAVQALQCGRQPPVQRSSQHHDRWKHGQPAQPAQRHSSGQKYAQPAQRH